MQMRHLHKYQSYEIDELIGKTHNIVRHPDMPKSILKNFGKHLKRWFMEWRGKNLRKDEGFIGFMLKFQKFIKMAN